MTEAEFAAWNEKMAQEFDPDLYHRSSTGIVRWVEGCRVKKLLKMLGAETHHTVLEVGVGAGNILEQIASKSRTGIDLSEFLLKKARARLGPDAVLIQGDAESLTDHLKPQSFDRVYCSEVLEHVQHPEIVMQQMATVVRQDGIVVVSVPNEGAINALKGFLKKIGLFRILLPNVADHMEDEWHLHVFSKKYLKEIATPHFHIDSIARVPFPFLPIRLVAKLRPKA